MAAALAGERIELHLADRTGAGLVEIALTAPLATRSERRAITDLLLEVTSRGGDIEPLLALANGRPAATGRRELFKARLMLVSGGRIFTETQASCGPWEGDISVCEMECDGGRFALRRPATAAASGMRVMVGALPSDIDGDQRQGFAISACGLEAEHEVRVVPRSGRGLVEIGFTAAPASD
jgi:hypothetical protein